MRKSNILSVLIFTLAVIIPTSNVEAQYNGSYDDQQNWSSFWKSSEGSNFDAEKVRQWREQNSRVKDAINELDDAPVDELSIPILFGVSLTDLYPNFGDPRDGGARVHEGFDMMATEGTPIVSPTEAVVIQVGDGTSSGKYVSTANPGGETFVYMHLSDIADIDEGDVLKVGDLIGFVGSTGNASGGASHLHFEIRVDREPTDPFKRLTREFSLEDKMEFLERMLDEVDDADKLAEFLVQKYQNIFVAAGAQGLDIPEMITEKLPLTARATIATGVPARDLQLGSSGPDVVALQSRLISEGYLDLTIPTDQFGPLTQAALTRYQTAKGITPANGYFGALTRASMSGSVAASVTTPASTDMTRAELIELIEKLLKQIEEKNK